MKYTMRLQFSDLLVLSLICLFKGNTGSLIMTKDKSSEIHIGESIVKSSGCEKEL